MPEDYSLADLKLLELEEMIHVGKYYKLEEVEQFEKTNPSLIPPQEEYPGLPDEKLLIGWRAICEPFGLKVGAGGKKPNSMKKHTKNENFPLMRMPNGKPYTYLTQIKEFIASSQKKIT